MRRDVTRLRTLAALGAANIARVAAYRLLLRAGMHPVQRARAAIRDGRFFRRAEAPEVAGRPTDPAPAHLLLFGRHPIPIGDAPPDWHADPLRPSNRYLSDAPWWRIPDFSDGMDVKLVWELSRFDWLVVFAAQARNGDATRAALADRWLADWVRSNPPYQGANWKCAQEAGLRLLHLAIAAVILDEDHDPTEAMQDLVEALLVRIAPTLSYATAQDNNHATSEAAALLVGGSWLALAGREAGERYARLGRRQLERHVGRLFSPDGSFSQQSLNYHRLALDTLSVVELWRRRHGLTPFSPRFGARARAAAFWLRAMVDPETGDAPNLGANDGANLFAALCGYRDYRFSATLATLLFEERLAFPDHPYPEVMAMLGLAVPAEAAASIGSALFDDGGYAVLRAGPAMALLRYPRFRFRPGQADALHLDLNVGGVPKLPDAGSFGYNAGERWLTYFASVEAHNSVQFDDTDQMVRLSRFLYGEWLETESTEPLVADGSGVRFGAAYRDRRGRRHARSVELANAHLIVLDRVEGFERRARLRWRLAGPDWRMEDGVATNGADTLRVTATEPLARVALVEGYESRFYMEKTPITVLEIDMERPGSFRTEFRWRA